MDGSKDNPRPKEHHHPEPPVLSRHFLLSFFRLRLDSQIFVNFNRYKMIIYAQDQQVAFPLKFNTLYMAPPALPKQHIQSLFVHQLLSSTTVDLHHQVCWTLKQDLAPTGYLPLFIFNKKINVYKQDNYQCCLQKIA
jgi:hypothetical protein